MLFCINTWWLRSGLTVSEEIPSLDIILKIMFFSHKVADSSHLFLAAGSNYSFMKEILWLHHFPAIQQKK